MEYNNMLMQEKHQIQLLNEKHKNELMKKDLEVLQIKVKLLDK